MEEKRNIRMNVYLSKSEKALIDKAAPADALQPAPWVRVQSLKAARATIKRNKGESE